MFISNNHPSFHLWWKEILVKYWKVSKYYGTDCRLITGFLQLLGSLESLAFYLFLISMGFAYASQNPMSVGFAQTQVIKIRNLYT